MHNNNTWAETLPRTLNLQLFAEGGGAGGGTGGGSVGAAASNGGASAPQTQTSDTSTGTGGAKESAPAGRTYTEADRDAVAKQFGLLNMDQVNSRFKGRFRDSDSYRDMAGTLRAVASSYGLKDTDSPDAILNAILTGPERIREVARQTGSSNDVAERLVRAEIENAGTKARQMAEARQTEQRRMEAAIEEVRKSFPDFDFTAESENPIFKGLVDTHVAEGRMSLTEAYAMANHATLGRAAIEAAREEGRKAGLAEAAQNGSRPREGGAGGRYETEPKEDLRKKSTAELQEIADKYTKR